MAGLAIITEACIDVKDPACVDVCPVQCIYELNPKTNTLFSKEEAGSGVVENSHAPMSAGDVTSRVGRSSGRVGELTSGRNCPKGWHRRHLLCRMARPR